jgi:hypothetical protein
MGIGPKCWDSETPTRSITIVSWVDLRPSLRASPDPAAVTFSAGRGRVVGSKDRPPIPSARRPVCALPPPPDRHPTARAAGATRHPVDRPARGMAGTAADLCGSVGVLAERRPPSVLALPGFDQAGLLLGRERREPALDSLGRGIRPFLRLAEQIAPHRVPAPRVPPKVMTCALPRIPLHDTRRRSGRNGTPDRARSPWPGLRLSRFEDPSRGGSTGGRRPSAVRVYAGRLIGDRSNDAAGVAGGEHAKTYVERNPVLTVSPADGLVRRAAAPGPAGSPAWPGGGRTPPRRTAGGRSRR